MYNNNGIGHQDNDASKEAASFNLEGKLSIRQQVANLFDLHGKLTVEQVSLLLNKPEISVQPRVTELKNSGYVKNSGDKRVGKWGTKVTIWEKV
jgi:hypothetical protein